MKRKDFIKASSSIVTAAMISPHLACNSKPAPIKRTNWAGNYTYKAPKLHEPKSVDELQELVRNLKGQKALGSTHCFNNIADSPVNQISTKHLNEIVNIDKDNLQVTVQSGMKYGDLAPLLEREGMAIHNLASLPHISVAGACATATHGSGVTNGNLATAAVGLEIIRPNGDVVQLNKGDQEFYGSVVNLGALGIVSKLTLAVEPSFQMDQYVFQDLPLSSIVEDFDAIMSFGYSVSLFTDWQDELVSQVWVKRKLDESTSTLPIDFYGAKAATKDLHPITALSAEPCTPQLGVPGPWYERLPHFKMGFTPSSGDELQAEYFVSRENALDALLALEKKKDLIFPELMISEIRTIAKDDLWLSTAYGRDSVAIHFTLKPNWPGVSKLLPVIENELAPYDARPHWGKLFTIAPDILKSRYPKMQDFINLVREADPDGKFKNEYLDLNIY